MRLPVLALFLALWPAQDRLVAGLPPAALQGGPRRPVRTTAACVVIRVYDGDTLTCGDQTRVRLIGIDTPELSQRPFGQAARAALLDLVPVGSTVQLEVDVERMDRYGRLLAYVWRNGLMANWVLARGGWAVQLTYPPNVQYADALMAAVREARREARGLWAVDGFACEPRDRRARRCE